MEKRVLRMRPKRHDAICESIQLALDLPLGLRPETRDDLADALGRFQPPERWGFVMLNPDQQRLVLRAIRSGARPLSTMSVWQAAISYLRYDTGEVMASRTRLAEDAGISPAEASRALNRLAEIGALNRIGRGRYAINPHVGWAGNLSRREEVAKAAPSLRLVEES